MNINLKPHFLLFSAMLLVLNCFVASPVYAQHYQIRTYQEWDGMPTNPVFDADQDSMGRMWFCSRVGIISYDGQHWKVHSFMPDASGQPQTKLKFDSRKSLWTISSRPPLRLSHRVGDQWTTVHSGPVFDQNYTMVGLEVLNLTDGTDRVALAIHDGYILIWDGINWELQYAEESTGNFQNTRLVGNQLFIAATKGLFKLQLDQPNSTIQKVQNIPDGPINHLAVAMQSDSLWLVGRDWLGIWDGSQFTYHADNLEILPPKTRVGTRALADHLGGIYFGGQQNVQYYHPENGLELLTTRNGLVAGGATAFFQDRESNIWITSTRGISKLISRRFAGYNRETGLLEDEVSSILQMKNGQIVLGHEGGLTFLGRKDEILRFKDAPPSMARVMDMQEDDDGNIWVAADRHGLAKLSPQGLMRWFGPNEGLTGGVFAIHQGTDNTTWAGTADGLFRKYDNIFEAVPLPGDTEAPLIRRLVPTADGSLYIATAGHGVFRYLEGNFTQYLSTNGKSGNNCYNVHPLPDGRILVGTSEGLFKIQDGKFKPTTHPDPVIDRPIYSILLDDESNLWFGTDLGIYRWNGIKLNHFTLQDGLLGNETNRAALIQTTDGNIWIGTESGASEYDPAFDVKASESPKLKITGFMVDGEIFPSEKELKLSQPPHTLEVLYEGFSFVDETRTHFQIQLQNFETLWHDVETPKSGARSLNYINIPAGKYRFLVKAIRVDGVSSEVMTSSWITIEPQFQDRWAVRLMFFIGAIGIVWALFALLSGRRYARRLEDEVYQQTWELRMSEESIKSESRRLVATLKNITDGVLAVNTNGIIVLANAAAEKILFCSLDEIMGRDLDTIIPIGHHKSGEALLHIPHPNVLERTLEVSTSEIPNPEQTSDSPGQGRVVAFRDITDMLHQEEERIRSQKLESLGVFAGGLAHDFNNLLTVMLGNLSILETSKDIPKSDMQMLSLVTEASQRAQSLTSQLLTFARGGMPLLETASIGQLVRQSIEFSLSGTNVSCTMDLPENLWPVEVDPGQIGQVLANLVINAVQAMPHGGNITITSRNIGSKSRPMVMVEIADEGVGIPPENLNRIFDPYFTTKDLGSGLGLAMAYSIISKHGGNITVDSKLGKGSVFKVFLKVSRSSL